ELGDSAAWSARSAVAGGELASRADEPPNGKADAQGQQHRDEQGDGNRGCAGARQRALSHLCRGSGAGRGTEQIAECRLLELLFHDRNERSALLEKVPPHLSGGGVE